MELIQQTLVIFTVFGVLGLTVWILRRKGLAQIQFRSRPGQPKRLELVDRLPLDAQHSVCLVRIEGELLAVGLSPSGCNTLCRLESAGGAAR